MDEIWAGIIGRAVETVPFLAYALYGWWTERNERIKLQGELVDVLKTVAGIDK
jgi:hypothetical protein